MGEPAACLKAAAGAKLAATFCLWQRANFARFLHDMRSKMVFDDLLCRRPRSSQCWSLGHHSAVGKCLVEWREVVGPFVALSLLSTAEGGCPTAPAAPARLPQVTPQAQDQSGGLLGALASLCSSWSEMVCLLLSFKSHRAGLYRPLL